MFLKSRNILFMLSILMILWGLFYFILNMSVAFFNAKGSKFPLYDVVCIQQNNKRVYIGLGFYNRIQVYDLNGNYIYSIKTDTYSKSFDFEVDVFGKITITNRNKKSKPEDKIFKIDSNLSYERSNMLPLTIMKNKNGVEELFIRESILNTLKAGIIPLFVLFFGILLFFSNLPSKKSYLRKITGF